MALLDMGIEVHAIAPPDGTEQKLTELGVKFHPWIIERRSMNPAQELISIHRLQKIYEEIKPDLVHHYTVKAVLYGTCLLYTSPSPRDQRGSRMPSSA